MVVAPSHQAKRTEASFRIDRRVRTFPEIEPKICYTLGAMTGNSVRLNQTVAAEKPNGRATIRDIASHAGVSITTVSRVLNDRPDVAPETR
jgi:Bacterial regulatory proteins, lacI family